MPIPGCGPSCSCCHYFGLVVESYNPNGTLAKREFTSDGDPWCGWAGGFPTPDPKNRKVCNFQQRGVPHGLTLAISGRVISRRQLVRENLAHSELVGSFR